MNITLNYGTQQLDCELADAEIIWQQSGPAALNNLAESIEAAFAEPVDYPQLEQAVVPGDQVTLVVDPETPDWPVIASIVGQQLKQVGIEPGDIRIVLNAEVSAAQVATVRANLKYPLTDYEEAMASQKVYLATTAEGERIYLPALIADADYVITLGLFGFDDVWGYRGTHSAIYPAFVEQGERERLLGKGHQELTPESSRGQRQTIDEIGWLLGVQYSIQVIPAGTGQVSRILCGASDSVFRQAVDVVNVDWRSRVRRRAETVIVSIPRLTDSDPWSAVSRACKVASQLVRPEGRVLLLTDLHEFPEGLADLLVGSSEEDRLIRRLQKRRTPAGSALAGLVKLTQRAKVYLLSQLEHDVVENLFCIPLSTPDELCKAAQGGETYAIVNGGQFAYVDR